MHKANPILATIAAVSFVAMLIIAPSMSSSQNAGSLYSLGDVVVEIAEDAEIDWNDPSEAAFEIERDMIRILFENAVKDGASIALTGETPARLQVTVTRFDILSTFELFFCCAVNEVAARFRLTNAADGSQIRGEDELVFDHIGRGGVFAAVAAEEGNDQIQRLSTIIREQTANWIKEVALP